MIKLDHHVAEAFVVGDKDKGVEVLARKLDLGANTGLAMEASLAARMANLMWQLTVKILALPPT